MDSEESWKLFVIDIGGCRKNGEMNDTGMINYRGMIELDYPLETDLLKCNLNVVPWDLKTWEVNKKVFNIFEKIVLKFRSVIVNLLVESDQKEHYLNVLREELEKPIDREYNYNG